MNERYARIVRRPDETPLVLVVGTVEVRKSVLALLAAVAALPELTIVAVDPPRRYADVVRARIAELRIERFAWPAAAAALLSVYRSVSAAG